MFIKPRISRSRRPPNTLLCIMHTIVALAALASLTLVAADCPFQEVCCCTTDGSRDVCIPTIHADWCVKLGARLCDNSNCNGVSVTEDTPDQGASSCPRCMRERAVDQVSVQAKRLSAASWPARTRAATSRASTACRPACRARRAACPASRRATTRKTPA
jgi:hypothetical protein